VDLSERVSFGLSPGSPPPLRCRKHATINNGIFGLFAGKQAQRWIKFATLESRPPDFGALA
jgi:hypothetical protein